MDERELRRLHLTRDIAKLLKYRSLHAALPPLRADGIAPFVVGLPDDTLGFISGRVAELGGTAHLIVPTEPSMPGAARLRILRVSESEHKPITDLNDRSECPVSEDSTLAMLLEDINVGDECTYYIYDTETVIRFINDSVQPIPA
jgi:hypothetical protein